MRRMTVLLLNREIHLHLFRTKQKQRRSLAALLSAVRVRLHLSRFSYFFRLRSDRCLLLVFSVLLSTPPLVLQNRGLA